MKKINAVKSNMSLAFNDRNIQKGGIALQSAVKDIKDAARDMLEEGLVKGPIDVLWQNNGKYVGAANFAMSTMLVENDVGVIVVSFSGFNSCIADLRYLQQKGYNTFAAAEKSDNPCDKEKARTVRLFLETFQGKFDFMMRNKSYREVKTYVSLTDSGTVENGYKIVDVNPINSVAAVDKICKLQIERVNFNALLQACLDMAAIARQSGESTIDTRKKPVLIVIAGIPGLKTLQTNVKYMSRDDIRLEVNWDEEIRVGNEKVAGERDVRLIVNDHDIIRRNQKSGKVVYDKDDNPHTCDFAAKEVGGADGASWQESIVSKNNKVLRKVLHMCDVTQRLRIGLFKTFSDWAKDIATEFQGNDIQKLSDKMMDNIQAAVTRYDSCKGFKVGIVKAMTIIGQEYQSAVADSSTKVRQIEKEGRRVGKPKIEIKGEVAQEKEKLSRILKRLSNKARVTFSAAEKILSALNHRKITISAADRIRVIWAAVLENAKNEKGGIEWKHLGTLAQNLLEPEYLLWVLDTFKDNDMVPKQTKDRLVAVGDWRNAPAEELQIFDGKKLPFKNGEFIVNGRVILECKGAALDGEFTVKVEQDDNGNVSLFATHDIADLVVVPEPDKNQVIVKLTATTEDVNEMAAIAKAAIDAETVFLFKGKRGQGCPIGVYNGDTIKTIGLFNVPAAAVAMEPLNIAYNDTVKCGIKGTVVETTVFEYYDKTGRKASSAFLTVDVEGPATPAERATAGIVD